MKIDVLVHGFEATNNNNGERVYIPILECVPLTKEQAIQVLQTTTTQGELKIQLQ